jgi:hypothetical protein
MLAGKAESAADCTAWFPLLHRLAPQAEMFVSALAAGFVFFLAATLLVACFSRPLSVNDKIERQLKRRGHNKAKPSLWG